MELLTIARIETPFTQKFGIPRQGNLALGVMGSVNFEPAYCNPDYLREIEQFSHLWLTFGFHQHFGRAVSPLVRPPRLGGNKKIGVFASRSSFRPNPIGLSLVKNKGYTFVDGQLKLIVEGVDLLTGTPIFDIKPYIPYSDTAPQATAGYATESPTKQLDVDFTGPARQQVNTFEQQYSGLTSLLLMLLANDPRPAYKKANIDDKQYTLSIYDLDVNWIVEHNQAVIQNIRKI